MRLSWLLLFLAACANGAPPPAAPVVAVAPVVAGAPIAEKKATVRELHGDKFSDDYFWLRNKGTPEVEQYLQAEAAYFEEQTKPLAELENTLYSEIVSHIAEDD